MTELIWLGLELVALVLSCIPGFGDERRDRR